MKKTFGAGAAFVLSLCFQQPALAEIMTNQSVVALVKDGLGDDLVIAKINSEPCNYDVSTDSILSLKNSGVSEKIITAMVTRCSTATEARGIAGDDASPDPMVRHSPGIYVMDSWDTPAALRLVTAATSSGMKTSGNGSVLFPLVARLILPGATSHLVVPSANPTFYFYFNPNDQAVSDFGQEHAGAAHSPDAFSLVRFKQKRDTRELEMGRLSAFGGAVMSFRKGLTLKSKIAFQTEDKGNGIYQVSTGPLEPGDYAFVFTSGDQSARVYDFTIAPTAPPQTAQK
jgi:hypothetical protein